MQGAATDALQRAQRDFESLTYSVAHDLRAPLRAVAGFAAMLAESQTDGLTPEGRHLVSRIVAGTRRMDAMFGAIASFRAASVEHLQPSPVELSPLINEIAQRYRLEYPHTAIDVEAPGTAVADPAALRKIIEALVDNALKFSANAHSPHVEISAPGADDADVITLVVRDNGVGFDPRYAGRLFGLFQRMHPQTAYPGVGAGLAIARCLAERMGGGLSAESELGAGAAFCLALRANR